MTKVILTPLIFWMPLVFGITGENELFSSKSGCELKFICSVLQSKNESYSYLEDMKFMQGITEMTEIRKYFQLDMKSTKGRNFWKINKIGIEFGFGVDVILKAKRISYRRRQPSYFLKM